MIPESTERTTDRDRCSGRIHIPISPVPSAPELPDATPLVRRVLERGQWETERAAFAERHDRVVRPHVERRSRHEPHPVADFLFEYYRFRPIRLSEWHPGTGVLLRDADPGTFDPRHGYVVWQDGVIQLPGPASIRPSSERFAEATRWMLNVLEATQARPPRFGCFGLHEWAMLYRTDAARHGSVPLRMSAAEVDRTVDTLGLRCSHFDAYRFFTEAAIPLNPGVLTRPLMAENEQPGCLHANMDVYRWAFKRSPWVGSDLVLDAFELALDIRHLDMASSPYDLAAWNIEPVPVETADGRSDFVRAQQDFHERAFAMRARLLVELRFLLEALHTSFAIAEPAS